jgi:hypothetical protein
MRVQSIHSRDLHGSPQELGRLVASLGSERDLLWPNDKWPGTQIKFDRPLGPGARGGHGVIRYSVEAYESDRWWSSASSPARASTAPTASTSSRSRTTARA